MGRIYVPSTPASRGEVEPGEEVTEDGFPADLTEEEVFALIEEAAAKVGYRLVPIESEGDEDPDDPEAEKPAVEEPAGNASTEEWEGFARSLGAQDSDLVDGQGEPLGRDALREKFGSKS